MGREANKESVSVWKKFVKLLKEFGAAFVDFVKRRGKYTYQFPMHGLAVSGFIFALLGLLTWGWIPLLSFIGLSCLVVAFAKGNFSSPVLVGFIIAVIGIILAVNHAADVAYLAQNPEIRDSVIGSAIEDGTTWLEEFLAKLVKKLSSFAS